MKPKECSVCGRAAKSRQLVVMNNGLCKDCDTDSRAPTPEQIAEECRKIRGEGPPNKIDAGLGKYVAEEWMPKIYRAPRGF